MGCGRGEGGLRRGEGGSRRKKEEGEKGWGGGI